MSTSTYVHGYSGREALRLNDQAETLDEIIHNDSVFSSGSLVLEAGCGVGAQTKIVAPKNPDSSFICIDLSEKSVQEAKKMAEQLNIKNAQFRQADILNLPYNECTFDAVFVCFVLEHLPDPSGALQELRRVLKNDGKIMIIEGDHGSTFFHPHSSAAQKAIECQVLLQKENGGNANIGRQLFPLLQLNDFKNISVTPRFVYADASKPEMVDGFIKNTFTAMIEGVQEIAVKRNLTTKEYFQQGIRDLYRTAENDGVFCYTFFKAFATK